MRTLPRRDFLALAAALSATAFTARAIGAVPLRDRAINAIAFDAFTTYDPRSVGIAAEKAFPGKGAEFTNVWRTRQFEYQWLHGLAGHYEDFWHATEGALAFAAQMLKLELTAEKRDALMDAFLRLQPWPDSGAALRGLKARGIRLALLSNVTPNVLDAWIANAGFGDLYDGVLSTDRIRTYKPDPRAYQMGVDFFGLPREQIAFAAFGGWDAAGAKWFGYPTFWVNRLGLPVEGLGVEPDGIGADLNDLAAFCRSE